jgi:predicted RNA-binding Zn-ribbon protein involved in translation (DUF1610 family)
METGSTCPNCGYRSEEILLVCPRCRAQMQHSHCRNCGRCPGPGKKENKDNKNRRN